MAVNQGKPWTDQQLDILTKQFRSRLQLNHDVDKIVDDFAYSFGRTRSSIESKLGKLGLLDRSYYVRRYKGVRR